MHIVHWRRIIHGCSILLLWGFFLKKEGYIGITLFHWSPETGFLDMEESSFWPVKSHQRKNTCAHPPPATHHRVGYWRLRSIWGHRSWSKSVPHAALELPDGWQKLMGVLTSCLRSCNCVHDFKKHWGALKLQELTFYVTWKDFLTLSGKR